jgi:flagellar hook-length control protein FliK
LSLLQLLAKTLEKDASQSAAATGSDAGATGSADQSTDDGTTATNDPSALALAMLAQAFAAAYAPPSASAAANAPQATASNADATSAGATSDVTSGGNADASAQQIIALLAKDLAATADGKSDADASRSDVAATKAAADNTAPAGSGATPSADSIAQSLSQMGFASHFSRTAHTADLKAPVGSQAWTDELGGHLTWMSSKGLESGSLRVSPEHLGPVEVQITVQNGDASVWFGASHPDTRAALEQALPQLRQMFASQGLTLSDSGVSRESPRNQGRSNSSSRSVSGVSAIGGSDAHATSSARVSLGLVDTYA